MTYEEKFNKSISHINREGIDNLVGYLKTNTDFFESPASTRFHANYEGGLVEHVINVLGFALTNFNFMLKKNPDIEYLKESVIICSLFHDLWKVNTYVKESRNVKNKNGHWVSYDNWEVKDDFPLGRGEKSVFILQKYINLTEPEAMAIRWHPGPFDQGIGTNGITRRKFEKAIEHPLVRIMHTADVLAIGVDGFIDYKSQAINS